MQQLIVILSITWLFVVQLFTVLYPLPTCVVQCHVLLAHFVYRVYKYFSASTISPVSILNQQYSFKTQTAFPAEMNHLQGESSISQPIHVSRGRIGPPSANHGPFTTKPSTHHVHSILLLTPPTSPGLTLSVHTKLTHKCTETVQCTE